MNEADQAGQVDEALKRILRGNVRPGLASVPIRDETDLMNELELDSLLIVSLFVDLEEEFGIRIEPSDLERPILKEYRHLREYIREKVAHEH